MIVEICGKCKDRTDLRKKYSGVYKVLYRRNQLDVYFPKKSLSL